MKTFTIVFANKQDRTSFETEASTVGELLQELRNRNIDYSGMTLYEGLTKCTFDPDNADGILPHDVPYTNKRTGEQIVTSNLVFMMSTKHKKTSSGMDRKALMTAVKEAGLCDAVKAAYGKNYTQVSSADLLSMLEEHNNASKKAEVQTVNNKSEQRNEPEQKNEDNPEEEPECEICPAKGLILGFIHTAIESGIIDTDEIFEVLMDLGAVKEVENPNENVDKKFDDDEIKSMFAGR